MQLYEVINPSDPVTVEAPSDLVAGLAGILLGRGAYGMAGEDGELALPLMLFGVGVALAEWLAKQGEDDLGAALEANRDAVIACLRSATLCKPAERASLVAAVRAGGGDPVAALAAFNESRRSSMNNICGRAFGIAESMEAAAAAEGAGA